jgi:hypothetical protein
MSYKTGDASQSTSSHEIYRELQRKTEKRNAGIYLHEEDASREEKLIRCLGDGGSKKAYKLDEERVLMLPNMDSDPLSDVAARWDRIVEEELRVTQLIASLGILSPISQRVNISSSHDQSRGTIPAYVSRSFNSFAQSNTFIIDRKNRQSSTWKQGRSLFNADENRLDKEKWDRMTATMLDDLVKIFANGLPTSNDSLNIAVVQVEDAGDKSHEIKIFGFDFTNKHKPLEAVPSPQSVQRSHVKSVVEGLLTTLFCYEFEWTFPYGERCKEPAQFMKGLVEDYTDKIMSQLTI